MAPEEKPKRVKKEKKERGAVLSALSFYSCIIGIFRPIMRKTFVSNLILLLALNLLVKPFYILGVEAEIQNRVGTEVFGSYFALINFSFVLNILLDMGTTNWNTRNLAQHRQLLQKQFPQIFTLRLVLAVLYMCVVSLLGFFLNYSTEQMIILGVLGINQVLASTILYLRSNLTGLHLFRQDSFISILDRLLLTIHMGILLWAGVVPGNVFHISWLVYGQTIACSITLIAAIFFVIRKSGRFRLNIDITFSRIVLKQSLPYALLIFVSMIAFRLDSVMLERISGAAEAGIYAMGFRFFEAFNMIAYLFAVLLLPIFSGMIKRKENISPLLMLAAKLMLVGAWTVAMACTFWSYEILSLFYDLHTAEASKAFSLLMAGCVCFSLQYVFGTLLTAKGNMKSLIYIATMGMVINFLLNFFLIPEFGAWGAALSNCITQALMLLGQIVLVIRYFHLKGSSAPLQMAAFICIVTLCGWFIHERLTIIGGHFTYSLAIFAALALFIALLTRMLDFKRFIQLVKSRE